LGGAVVVSGGLGVTARRTGRFRRRRAAAFRLLLPGCATLLPFVRLHRVRYASVTPFLLAL